LVKTVDAAVTLMESDGRGDTLEFNGAVYHTQLPLRTALTLNELGVLVVHFTKE
jgi:hypothetical protein